MSFTFNADEILEMAQQIERNGARFYRKAAELLENADVRKLLLDLAAWEDEHEKTFAAMRTELKEQERRQTVFDPDHETSLYLQAMADGHVFDVQRDPASLLTGGETVEEVLRLAIGQEKDSIVFYLGFKELTSDPMGRQRVDAIIKEEMRHIGVLNRQLTTLRREGN
jgi:rubrerythrin